MYKHRRCNKELSKEFKFCPFCGKNQTNPPQKQNRRINGTGSIYVRKDLKTKPYAVSKYVDSTRVYVGNYATRTEAVRALQEFEYNPVTCYNITLEQLHEEWEKITYKKIGESTQDNYNSAWYKLQPLYKRKFRDIRTGEMQAIIDFYEAPHHEVGTGGRLKYIDDKGKGTYKVTDKPKMSEGLKFSALHKIKCLLTSMYTYAMKNDIVNKNYAEFIELPEKNETSKSRLTDTELEKVRLSIGVVPYADYILLCVISISECRSFWS